MQLIEAALPQKISNLHTARIIDLTVKLALCNRFYDAIFQRQIEQKFALLYSLHFHCFVTKLYSAACCNIMSSYFRKSLAHRVSTPAPVCVWCTDGHPFSGQSSGVS